MSPLQEPAKERIFPRAERRPSEGSLGRLFFNQSLNLKLYSSQSRLTKSSFFFRGSALVLGSAYLTLQIQSFFVLKIQQGNDFLCEFSPYVTHVFEPLPEQHRDR